MPISAKLKTNLARLREIFDQRGALLGIVHPEKAHRVVRHFLVRIGDERIQPFAGPPLGLDILVLVGSGYANATAALAALRAVPEGLRLDLPAGGGALLEGLSAGALRVQDILIG
ncbi:hypothetical protein J4558_15045 [Leptolyngbya sp. 15MV]|nr:hypothetical protein J4558_15045 [Leptolyngbya sp. 15MV]